jgi:hypothetical protein
MDADWLLDETPVRSLCGRMVCTACGLIGALIRLRGRTARPPHRPAERPAVQQQTLGYIGRQEPSDIPSH